MVLCGWHQFRGATPGGRTPPGSTFLPALSWPNFFGSVAGHETSPVHCLGAVSFWASPYLYYCIIHIARPKILAVSPGLGHGRRCAGQELHGDHDHPSACARPGASGFGRSKALRKQVGRDPGVALQGSGHEGRAPHERKDGQCGPGAGRASSGEIRFAQKEEPEIRDRFPGAGNQSFRARRDLFLVFGFYGLVAGRLGQMAGVSPKRPTNHQGPTATGEPAGSRS